MLLNTVIGIIIGIIMRYIYVFIMSKEHGPYFGNIVNKKYIDTNDNEYELKLEITVCPSHISMKN